MVILYGVELSYATVLMSQSNLLLVESSSRGVVRLCWLVVMSLVVVVVSSLGIISFFNIIGISPHSFQKKT